jgi:hypothetical protein
MSKKLGTQAKLHMKTIMHIHTLKMHKYSYIHCGFVSTCFHCKIWYLKTRKQFKDFCFQAGLYSMREKQKSSKILSTVSSCVSFVPVIICIIYPELSSKGVDIPVLISVFVCSRFFLLFYLLQCILNVLLPAYIFFFCH